MAIRTYFSEVSTEDAVTMARESLASGKAKASFEAFISQ